MKFLPVTRAAFARRYLTLSKRQIKDENRIAALERRLATVEQVLVLRPCGDPKA